MKENNKKAYAAILSCLVIAVAAGAGIAGNKSAKKQNEPVIENSSPVSLSKNNPSIPLEKVKVKSEPKKEVKKEPVEETKPVETKSKEEPINETIIDETEDIDVFDDYDNSTPVFALPCDGDIIMKYSADIPVFDQTLEQFRTNDCISISAPVGSSVLCSADGTVETITSSDEHGLTVTVFHSNGWRTTYGQLDEALAVEEGDMISKGTVIGTVAQPSKYSIMLGSHADFGMTLDNEPVDPLSVISN